jgi:hypothetical protein
LVYDDAPLNSQYGILRRIDIDNDDMKLYLEVENSDSVEYKLNIEKIINTKDIVKYFNESNKIFEVYTNLRIVTKIQLVPNLEEALVSELHSNVNEIQESIKFILKPLEVLLSNLVSIRHIGMIKEKNETFDYGLDYIGYFGEKYKDRALNLTNTKGLESSIKHIFDYDLVVSKSKQELFLEVEGKKLQLHMFGSSINSTIPILTQFAVNNEKQNSDKYRLTIIEEPELNLHPQSQARFVEAIFTKNRPKKHFTIMETHSDHILNKIRFLVSNKTIDVQDVVIYYKQKDSKFKKIEINKCGEFTTSFPKGFYDATLEDIYALGNDC